MVFDNVPLALSLMKGDVGGINPLTNNIDCCKDQVWHEFGKRLLEICLAGKWVLPL